jgi:hypothetical protein
MAASTPSGPEPERISLRELIQTAAAAYDDGPWDHLIDQRGKLIRPDEAGDTLVDFIIRELGDTYDPDATRAQQIEAAFQAMSKAESQVNDVTLAIGRLAAQ